jgi:hypothetical protein
MEQTLVSTQEVNVNLQILLERAVLSQKKLDTDTMQQVRQFQGDLSKVSDEPGPILFQGLSCSKFMLEYR